MGVCVADDAEPTQGAHEWIVLDPRNAAMGLAVEPEYAGDKWWAQVDFPPVPAFEISTHDPETQDRYISASAHHPKGGPWDPFVWDLFARVLKNQSPNDCVVDVGANLGYFSLMAASLGFRVTAFEPMNRNAAKLCSSIVRNGFDDRIRLYHHAVSRVSGSVVSLKETDGLNQGNGQLQPERPALAANAVYGRDYVRTVRLDDVPDLCPHGEILLIKMDVEGAEALALDGAWHLLRERTVRFVTIEWSTETRSSRRCPAPRLLEVMNALGYDAMDIVEGARPLAPHEWQSFPPNLLFRLRDAAGAQDAPR